MGLFIKKNHGTEYLYSLAGKRQFFLGRKDDPNNLNQENLDKAIKIIDESFEKQLEKYILDLEEHALYMVNSKKRKYLTKRKENILKNILQQNQ